MSRRFSKVVPQSPLELERFYLDTINKLENTTSSLADEEQKSGIPVIGMIHDISRRVESLVRDNRNLKLSMDNSRLEQDNRIMRSQLTKLETRLADLEKRVK